MTIKSACDVTNCVPPKDMTHYNGSWWRKGDIWLHTESDEEFLMGWYFSDEVEQLHGPFSTIEETRLAYRTYCQHI